LFLVAAFIVLSQADYFTEKLPEGCGTALRTRSSWDSISKEDKQLFANVVYKMKQLRGKWSDWIGQKETSLYDFFVNVHANMQNSYGWHGTSFFLPAHKWYLWSFESALIYTAYTNREALGITQEQACSMAIPYWDWTLDCDYNGKDNVCPVLSDNNSGIWDADAFGSAKVEPGTNYVIDGIPYYDDWICVGPTSSNPNYPDAPDYPNYDNWLKRDLYCGPNGYSLSVGPSQAMFSVTTLKTYKLFASWVEGTGHGVPHMFCGFTMAMMFSPDDPLFWLHHCNVDHLYHLWIDCQGMEKISSSKLTSSQYSAWTNQRGSSSTSFSSTSEIPYYWGDATTVLFPKDKKTGKWPNPTNMWDVGVGGVTGYDGMNYEYGPDQLVRGFGKSCPDQTWSICDVGYVPGKSKKRDEILHPTMQEFKDIFEAKVSEGKSHQEAIHEMAMTECQNAPKNEITPGLQRWIEMNGLLPEQFDSICDKPSERMGQAQDTRGNQDATVTNLSGSATPLWVIIVASVGSALILIAVIALVIISIRRKAQVAEKDGSYRQM